MTKRLVNWLTGNISSWEMAAAAKYGTPVASQPTHTFLMAGLLP